MDISQVGVEAIRTGKDKLKEGGTLPVFITDSQGVCSKDDD